MRLDPLAYLGDDLNSLKSQGLYRRLRVLDGEQAARTLVEGKSVVNLSSNNYLGLTTHPKLKALTRYTHFSPAEPMSSPPIAGPATDAAWIMIVFKLMAFGRCSRGTSIGRSA